MAVSRERKPEMEGYLNHDLRCERGIIPIRSRRTTDWVPMEFEPLPADYMQSPHKGWWTMYLLRAYLQPAQTSYPTKIEKTEYRLFLTVPLSAKAPIALIITLKQRIDTNRQVNAAV